MNQVSLHRNIDNYYYSHW